MKSIRSILSPALLTALALPASATVTMDYVAVGNPGNAADSTTYGAVAYAYQIGKYKVTNAPHGEFAEVRVRRLIFADRSVETPTGVASAGTGLAAWTVVPGPSSLPGSTQPTTGGGAAITLKSPR